MARAPRLVCDGCGCPVDTWHGTGWMFSFCECAELRNRCWNDLREFKCSEPLKEVSK